MRELARNRWIWAIVVAILVLGPAFFALTRQRTYTATQTLTPVQVGKYGPISDPGYYNSLLRDPILRAELNRTVGPFLDYERVSIDPAPGGRLTVTVKSDTPQRAHSAVNGVAHQLTQASRRQLGLQVQQELATLGPLAAGRGRGPLRRRIVRQVRALQRLGPMPPARAIEGRPGDLPEATRWSDKLADALPGDPTGRPSPFWAALSGLLLAGTLWGIAFVLGRRPDRS